MAIYMVQSYTLTLFGDGTSTTFSYDLSKPPVSSNEGGVFEIGSPSQVEGAAFYQGAPQVGQNTDGSAILDEPTPNPSMVGTVLTVTFSRPLLQFGGVFVDGNNLQWPINSPYVIEFVFDYNSVA